MAIGSGSGMYRAALRSAGGKIHPGNGIGPAGRRSRFNSRSQCRTGICAGASEDFANIASRVPSAFIYLSAGYTDERGTYPAHNPKA